MPFVNRRDNNKKSQVSLRVEKEKKKSDDDSVWGGQSFPLLFFLGTFERRETDDDREEDSLAIFLFETRPVVSKNHNKKKSNCHILSLSLKSIAAKVERD